MNDHLNHPEVHALEQAEARDASNQQISGADLKDYLFHPDVYALTQAEELDAPTNTAKRAGFNARVLMRLIDIRAEAQKPKDSREETTMEQIMDRIRANSAAAVKITIRQVA